MTSKATAAKAENVNDAIPADAEAPGNAAKTPAPGAKGDRAGDLAKAQANDAAADEDGDPPIPATEPQPGDPDFEGAHDSGEDDVASGDDISTNEDVQERRDAKAEAAKGDDAPVGFGEVWMTTEYGTNPIVRWGGNWQVVNPVFWKRVAP